MAERASGQNSDRRRYPRVLIRLPVMVHPPAGEPVRAVIVDLSPGGLRIRCDQATARVLVPDPARLAPGREAPSVGARFPVPLIAGRRVVTVECQVVRIRIVPDSPPTEVVAIGLKFRRFDGIKSLRRLVRFVEEQLIPKEAWDQYPVPEGARPVPAAGSGNDGDPPPRE